MTVACIIDSHGCETKDLIKIPSNVNIYYRGLKGECTNAISVNDNYSFLKSVGKENSNYVKTKLKKLTFNQYFAKDIIYGPTEINEMCFQRERGGITSYWNTPYGGFKNHILTLDDDNNLTEKLLPFEEYMEIKLSTIIDDITKKNTNTNINIYINACRALCTNDSDDSDDSDEWNEFEKQLENSMEISSSLAFKSYSKKLKRKSPKRKSPKRKSPKRKSPKRKSPKRKSPKRKSPKNQILKKTKFQKNIIDDINSVDWYIFTLNTCGYCNKAKKLLEDNDKAFKSKEITDQNNEEIYKSIDILTDKYRYFPIIFHKGKFIGGYTELKNKFK